MKRFGFFAATAIVAASLTAAGAGIATAAPQVDPLAPGPHKVAEASYHLGDDALRPDAFPWPVELTGHVYYPEKPAVSAYPVVVFLHGRHATCMSSTVPTPRLAWPCPAGYQPIPSHRGYDYLGRQLAGHGYAVISISANGINGNDALDANSGQRARGELVLKHLDLWNEWRTKPGGPVPVSVTRSFDFDRIGLMGHSRGGEGVVNAVEQNALREKPYRLRALLPLAATDFERRIPVGITMATLQPDCDGDVSDLQGVHYYDDGRYYVRTDRATRNNVTVLGANHNFFNTNWSPSSGLPGAVDDWRGGQGDPNSSCHPSKATRLTEQQQRNVGIAYINGFFRHYLGGEKALAPLWRGAAGPPASVAPATVNVSYHPPSASGQRLDVNREDGYRDINTLGGKVVATGVKQIACGGPNPGEFASCLSKPGTRTSEPHRGWGRSGVLAARTTWAATGGTVTNEVPAPHGDVAKYAAVQFRAGVDFSDPANAAGQPQDLRIVLTDAAGKTASVKASEHGKALAYPLQGGQNDVLPRMHLNQVRVPLSAFAGVDLTKITSVALALDVNPTGALAVSDLVFTD
ncbi:poly(ethylene terephthalate) hydrolase family protein [Allokutzneria albata]|uniref:PET hydrolase/cutinase-like domain-containing protein n=1 Tax=Allokutzneria albata TaxID=211114 RepID=A0A1H0BV55_ALLAB|nr:alpha/beta hydrolase [Allokutzneria albata]SDN49477.1 hypothetical protein SAMN04489726_6860 [Allokutzneria albata]